MENKRILWIDWVKFLAIIGIIGVHVSSTLVSPEFLFESKWFQGVFADSIFRFGIILFIMASGFLILRKQQTINDVPRRFVRIVQPFIFWLILYAIVKVVVAKNLGPNWNIIQLITFTLGGFLNPTDVSVQFWYVYMILGLYVLSPILSRWIQNAPIREIEYFLFVWLLMSLIYFFEVHTILTDYFRYFTGAIGYFILGYYLTIKKTDLLESRKSGIILFLIGTLITTIGTIVLSYVTMDQSYYFLRLGDITPGACLQAIGLFIIIKNTDFTKFSEKINKWVVKISKASYGIYMANLLVIHIMDKVGLLNLNHFTFIMVLVYLVLVLILSYLVILIMDKLPFLNQFSGIGK